MEIRSDFLLLLGSGRGWSESCTEASDNMFIGSTLGRIAVTRARAEAVIAQLDSRLKSSERELRTGAADCDRAAALTDECASLVGIARGNNVYYAWLRTVSATGVAPLARGTALLTSPTPASPRRQAASSEGCAPTQRPQLALAACVH